MSIKNIICRYMVCNKWNRMSPDPGAEVIKYLDILTTSLSIGIFMTYSYMIVTSGIDMEKKYFLAMIVMACVSNVTSNYLWTKTFPDDEQARRYPNVYNVRRSIRRRKPECGLMLSAPRWCRKM